MVDVYDKMLNIKIVCGGVLIVKDEWIREQAFMEHLYM